MSREIKFRVWGKTEKEYIRYPFAWLSLFDSPDGLEIEENEDLVIEQYTGLKDKNGKEIYEGDILQIDDHILGDFVVVWHNFGWKIKRSVGYESLSVHKSEDCTVIGNIHENPELLEDK
jgi:uncharacterized phage protein (TIGR01671 family)